MERLPFSEEVLRLLACPRCKGPLTLEAGGGSAASGPEALCCADCRLAYPVRDGVPELLSDEARPRPASGG